MIDLAGTAHQLLKSGKGILAADESTPSADKRLAQYGIETGPEMRRKYRDLFLAAPGIEQYLSGVILYEETLTEKANDGTLFPELLLSKGIIPGIKVDQGLEPFPEGGEENITNGLLGLPERLAAYRAESQTGFTKWRALMKIDGTRLPTPQAIVENAKRLAQYASDAQVAGMLPLVEPEVFLEGPHSRVRCKEVLTQVVSALVSALLDQAVDLSGVILKTSMVLSGSTSGHADTPEEVANDTLDVLLEHVPKQMGGIVFLSGGQSTEEATANLRAIEDAARARKTPWHLTFSYARALQDEALRIWQGKDENVDAARAAFLTRLKEDACFTLPVSDC